MSNYTVKQIRGKEDQPVLLRNVTCVYCGCDLTNLSSTKEHVIGTRFVPKGTLDAQWNLIVRACNACNGKKSALEDDISAITMQPTVFGTHAVEDERLAKEAIRKAVKSFSQKTKKRVGESAESTSVTVSLGAKADATFGMVCPPQLDWDRAFLLSHYHVLAFFYMLTFNSQTNQGWPWKGNFMPIHISARGDWGSSLNFSFMNTVASWSNRLHLVTANGFFKAAIRRHPVEECWSWALEWNQNHRIIGFLGDSQTAQAIFDSFQTDRFSEVYHDAHESVRIREEIPLNQSTDTMFMPPVIL